MSHRSDGADGGQLADQCPLRQVEAFQTLRAYWRADPVLYARQRLGLLPTDQQAALLRAIAPPGAKVSVRAGHGVGKTAATAAAIWWHLECFDYSKTPCTAPTSSQLETILWAELARLMRQSDAHAEERGVPAALYLSALFDLRARSITDRGAPREWFAIGRTARRDQPDALQGFHASDVALELDPESGIIRKRDQAPSGGGADAEGQTSLMFVIEEASGVADAIFEVAEGALSSPGARLLMVGNPTRNTGFFARSHQQDRGAYHTLRFRCADSPLVDPGYRDGLVRKYGAESNIVRVRADGAFPKQDDDVLIPIEWTEAALDRPAFEGSNGQERRLGVDVARFGDDRTVFVLRAGPGVLGLVIAAQRDTMAVAGQARLLADQWGANRIFVDEIGVGGGVVDRLREDGAPVVAVNVAHAAPVRTEAQGRSLRDHLWLTMRDWLRNEPVYFATTDRSNAEDLAGELSSIRYGYDGSGRMIVERKEQMKARGLRSPDLADALALTFYTAAPAARIKTLHW